MAITKGEGLTPSERRLAALADRTFLRLWSYPNVFNDRTKTACGGGQEIADLLAVFDDHVFIFSDKQIVWHRNKPIGLAWSRWYRRAVEGSVVQLEGAERWLDRHPDRIFTDKHCRQVLPIDLPLKEKRKVHLVAVVGGVNEEVRRYFRHPRGTLMIQPGLVGSAHVDTGRVGFQPFVIGDVAAGNTFVHVFDPVSLEIVMSELDTVSDFADYLVARAAFLRSGRLGIASGEEDLLASYVMNGFMDGKPEFVPAKLRKRARRQQVSIPETQYATYVSSNLYARLTEMRHQSMLWDEMVEIVSEGALQGTSIAILGQEPSPALTERALRLMAGERRMDRVMLASALGEAIVRAAGAALPRLVRRVMIPRRRPRRNVGYVFLFAPHDPARGSYDQYRDFRSHMLSTYCLSFLREQPALDFVIGLALDLRDESGSLRTRSEDVIAMESPDWSGDLIERLEHDRRLFEMQDPEDLVVTGVRERIRNPFRLAGRRSGIRTRG